MAYDAQDPSRSRAEHFVPARCHYVLPEFRLSKKTCKNLRKLTKCKILEKESTARQRKAAEGSGRQILCLDRARVDKGGPGHARLVQARPG